ncbi:hypothetical protein FOZ61_006820 [Perkinsus olseni]|uniref:Uncharacterized protein n=1 Tax=Perkinsus olseni TaxID=32597 RepID=A0A7J6MHB0_PEROL|nr:hypothetical protein FOZ61_006820 [Perkinsus olseni]KAF4676064.1 hypothetical protein FOL46_007942 [Perkinsus olseni]
MSEDLQKVKLCLGLVCGALRRTALAAAVADKLEKYLNQIDAQTNSINGDFLNTLTNRIDAMEAMIDGGDVEKLPVGVHCEEHEEMQKVKLSLGLICGTLRRLASAQGVLAKIEKHITQIDKQTSSIHGDVLTVLNQRVGAQENKVMSKLKKGDGGAPPADPSTLRRDDLEDLQKAKLCLGLVCATLRRIASSAGVLQKVEKFIRQIDSQTSSINGDYLNNMSARLDRIDEIVQSLEPPGAGEARKAAPKTHKSFIRKAALSAEGADDLQKVKLCLGLLCAVARRTVGAAGIADKAEKHLVQIDQQTSGINGDILNKLLGRIEALEHRMDVQEKALGSGDDLDERSKSADDDINDRVDQMQATVTDIERRLGTVSSSMQSLQRKSTFPQLSVQGPEEMVDQRALQRRLIILEAKLDAAEEDRIRIDGIQARIVHLEAAHNEVVESMGLRVTLTRGEPFSNGSGNGGGVAETTLSAPKVEVRKEGDEQNAKRVAACCMQSLDDISAAMDGFSAELDDLRLKTDAMQGILTSPLRFDEALSFEFGHSQGTDTRATVERARPANSDQAGLGDPDADWSQDGDLAHIAERLEAVDTEGSQQQPQSNAQLQASDRNSLDLRREVLRVSERMAACRQEISDLKKDSSRLTAEVGQIQRDTAEVEKALQNSLGTVDTRVAVLEQSVSDCRENVTQPGPAGEAPQQKLPLKSQPGAACNDLPGGSRDEDMRLAVAALTRAVVRFAQIVGIFPAPRFEELLGDAERGLVQIDPKDLAKWQSLAETLSLRIDKSWKQRSCGRFRNILDLLARKADSSILKLQQMSQRQMENQLCRLREAQVNA